jgi:hypothetical protein
MRNSGESNPDPLHCHQQAPRPLQYITAGHRPRTCTQAIQIRAGCGTSGCTLISGPSVRLSPRAADCGHFDATRLSVPGELGEGPGRPSAPGRRLREADRDSATARRRSFGDGLWDSPCATGADDWLIIGERDRPPATRPASGTQAPTLSPDQYRRTSRSPPAAPRRPATAEGNPPNRASWRTCRPRSARLTCA